MIDNVVSTVSDDEEDADPNSCPKLQGYLNKWTNYIYGWQKRWIVLKDGALSYYKTKNETGCGCRGAISLYNAFIKVSSYSVSTYSNLVSFLSPLASCGFENHRGPNRNERYLRNCIRKCPVVTDVTFLIERIHRVPYVRRIFVVHVIRKKCVSRRDCCKILGYFSSFSQLLS